MSLVWWLLYIYFINLFWMQGCDATQNLYPVTVLMKQAQPAPVCQIDYEKFCAKHCSAPVSSACIIIVILKLSTSELDLIVICWWSEAIITPYYTYHIYVELPTLTVFFTVFSLQLYRHVNKHQIRRRMMIIRIWLPVSEYLWQH